MPRVSDARERLLESALDLIWAHSYGSTSVDAICEKAKVKKGSFYYFFQSKSDLAIAALEAGWAVKKLENDRIFSSTSAPLERLRQFFEASYQKQLEMKAQGGYVLGCPLFSLGCELSTQDQAIRAKVEEILQRCIKYFETAIRDAHAEGAIVAPDALAKARQLFAYHEGVLAQARIDNDLSMVRDLAASAAEFLGARAEDAKTAA
jgi:TetR/AcrR family transcriptional repressor of nem operon